MKKLVAASLFTAFLVGCGQGDENVVDESDQPVVENVQDGKAVDVESDREGEASSFQLSMLPLSSSQLTAVDLVNGNVISYDFLGAEQIAGRWVLENGYFAVWVEWADLETLAFSGVDISEYEDLEPTPSRFVLFDNGLNYVSSFPFNQEETLAGTENSLRIWSQGTFLSWVDGELFVYGQTTPSNGVGFTGEIVRHNLMNGATEVIGNHDLEVFLSIHGFVGANQLGVLSFNNSVADPQLHHGVLDLSTGDLQLLERSEQTLHNHTFNGSHLLVREMRDMEMTGEVVVVDFQTMDVVSVMLSEQDSVRARLTYGNDGIVTVSGDGEMVRLYDLSGVLVGEASLTVTVPDMVEMLAARFVSIYELGEGLFSVQFADGNGNLHIETVELG